MINHLSTSARKNTNGFTLLELLIVIAIIAILAVMLIIVINPIETLRKSRDSQRLSDLNTIKTAIGIYTTTITNPSLDGNSITSINTYCKPGVGWSTSARIWYSYPTDNGTISGITITGTSTLPAVSQTTKANQAKVDGTGWMPIDFSSITYGSPISNLPVDPVNTVTTLNSPKNSDLVYRYVCGALDLSYEINTRLESNEYTSLNNKMQSDGGDNDTLYETGTNLRLIGAGNY